MYDIYSGSENGKQRYFLGKNGEKKLFVIGLNPSTATKEKSDTTVAKVEVAARQNGFDGFVMLNLYPVRATDYKQLPLVADSSALLLNLSKIDELIAAEKNPIVWAAWGDCVNARSYFVLAIQLLHTQLLKRDVTWRNFGELTKQGHPRHPSRLQYAWTFSDFDAGRYIARFS